MKIEVKVKTKAKENKVEKIADGKYLATTTAAPERGKANEKILEMLAEKFKTAKSNLRITHGEKSKSKVVEIDN